MRGAKVITNIKFIQFKSSTWELLKSLTKFKGTFLIIEKFGGPWPQQLIWVVLPLTEDANIQCMGLLYYMLYCKLFSIKQLLQVFRHKNISLFESYSLQSYSLPLVII